MRSERGGMVWSTFAIIGIVVVLLLLGVCALVNDDDDPNSFGPLQLVSHQYGSGYDDGGECWDEYDCQGRDYGRDDYNQNYGSRDDRNRNRNRDRGAFSPGPFRDSPVVICAPYSCNSGGEQSGGNRNDRRDEPPPDERERA